MRVRYTPRARSDLQSILQYIDERSPLGARSVKRAIRKTIELIGEFPEGGRRAGEQAARVLPAGRYPYLIYWSVEGGEAWIVHIRHASRRPWKGDD
jgi:plasmid stabilization system protein ParE